MYRFAVMFGRAMLLLSMLLAVSSCDEKRALVVLEPKGSGAKVQLEPIAQLVANRITHVAVDALGNLYWSQESDDGQDLLFVIGLSIGGGGGGGNLPTPAALSSASVLSAMKPLTGGSSVKSSSPRAPKKPGGNIQSLVTGSDGALYFYFNGGFGPTGAQAVGRFDPRTQEVQIVADTEQLASSSEMGRSLDLARGELIVCGQVVRLFLRHSDNWAILEFEPNRLPAIGQGHLTRPIRRVRVTDPVDLTSPDIDLSTGPTISTAATGAAAATSTRNAMLMLDRRVGAMYVVDDNGNGTMLASMVNISERLSQPLIDRAAPAAGKDPERPERILIFAADGALIDPPVTVNPPPAPNLLVQYPALLMIDPATGQYGAISKDDIHAPGSFAIYATRLQQLVPIARNTFVGYDASSGQLLKVSVSR